MVRAHGGYEALVKGDDKINNDLEETHTHENEKSATKDEAGMDLGSNMDRLEIGILAALWSTLCTVTQQVNPCNQLIKTD